MELLQHLKKRKRDGEKSPLKQKWKIYDEANEQRRHHGFPSWSVVFTHHMFAARDSHGLLVLISWHCRHCRKRKEPVKCNTNWRAGSWVPHRNQLHSILFISFFISFFYVKRTLKGAKCSFPGCKLRTAAQTSVGLQIGPDPLKPGGNKNVVLPLRTFGKSALSAAYDLELLRQSYLAPCYVVIFKLLRKKKKTSAPPDTNIEV